MVWVSTKKKILFNGVVGIDSTTTSPPPQLEPFEAGNNLIYTLHVFTTGA
jgi:hypothetical protein